LSSAGAEAGFWPRARIYYDALPPESRGQIDAIREFLEMNPDPDGRLKHPLTLPNLFVYEDDRWALLYEIAAPGELTIGDIARLDQPRPWRLT